MNILDHILPARRRRIREVREVLLGETAWHKEARYMVLTRKMYALMKRGEHMPLVRDYITGRLSSELAQKILDGEIK